PGKRIFLCIHFCIFMSFATPSDSNDENCPVYTAMHGEGEWEPECIAERIEDIIEKVKGNVG
ncbi:hypothetical protein P4J17_26110, partial [Bacillus cereus]|nr:hypothetical protein [Bacillus cereus]